MERTLWWGLGLLVGCGEPVVETPLATVDVFDGSIRLDEDETASVLLTADVSTDETPRFEIVSDPSNGRLVGSGAFYEYVPDENVNGVDSFTFRAFLSEEETSDVATITVFVDAVNDPPQGQALQIVVQEDTPSTASLPANDIEGDPLVFSLLEAPTSGRVDIEDDGTFTYTPDRDFFGSDGFLWAATDDSNLSTGAIRVDIDVAEVNDPPVVLDNGFVGPEDTVIEGTLLATDPDGDELTWTVTTQPSHGSLLLNTAVGSFTYTPDTDYFGPDAFEVTVSDRLEDSDPAVVDLTITAVNDPPILTAKTLTTDEDTPLADVVVATDPDGDVVTYRIDQPPTLGIASIDRDTGALTYTPNKDLNGTDNLTIVASDPFEDSPARLTIIVVPVNDPPRLDSIGLLTTDEDTIVTGIVTGSDPEGDTLNFFVEGAPAHGNVTISAGTGALAYTPGENYNGIDQFRIAASDGTDPSAPAVIDVLVAAVNDPPVAMTSEVSTLTGEPVETTLLANDPDGDMLFYVIETPPDHGSANVDAETGVLRYVPEPGYDGRDVVEWSVSDGELSASSALSIVVDRDGDGDSVGDETDNCPDVPNPDQDDADGNGVGDVCDCYLEQFDVDLNDDFFAASFAVTNVEEPVISDTHALRLNGSGAFVETVGLPGCPSFYYELQVAAGPPAPDVTDALRLSARLDGGSWVTLTEVFGLGVEQSYEPVSGQTGPVIDLSGGVAEFRLEVISDEADDLFFIDDLRIDCDTDSDFLVDCVESGLDGYDLTEADADMDGLIDAEEFEKGTDPNLPDTDFDGVNDRLDNCPLAYNPTQTDSGGGPDGDACEIFGFYEDFESGPPLDSARWEPLVGSGDVRSDAGYFRDAFALYLDGVPQAVVTTRPFDFSSCPTAALSFEWVDRSSESGDDVEVTYTTDGAAFQALGTLAGATSNGPWNRFATSFSDPVGFGSALQLRFTQISGSTPDEFYVDNLAFDCDIDGDGLGNVLERDVLGTDPNDPDTDGDGIADGDEYVAGTL